MTFKCMTFKCMTFNHLHQNLCSCTQYLRIEKEFLLDGKSFSTTVHTAGWMANPSLSQVMDPHPALSPVSASVGLDAGTNQNRVKEMPRKLFAVEVNALWVSGLGPPCDPVVCDPVVCDPIVCDPVVCSPSGLLY